VTLVVDASVGLKWVLQEADSPLAERLACRGELLDPVVVRISDEEVSLRIDGEAARKIKLAGAVAAAMPPGCLWVGGPLVCGARRGREGFVVAPVHRQGRGAGLVLGPSARLNGASYGDGKPSRWFGAQYATEPICSGARSG